MKRKSGDLHRMRDDMYRRWNRKVSMNVYAGVFPIRIVKGNTKLTFAAG